MAVSKPNVLYDTNILIDALRGIPAAFDELSYWPGPAISALSVVEVCAGARTDAENDRITAFIKEFGFEVIHTDDRILRLACDIRRFSVAHPPKVKTPDTIVCATAISHGLIVITRNPRDFKPAVVRVPYELRTLDDGTVEAFNIMPSDYPPRQPLGKSGVSFQS